MIMMMMMMMMMIMFYEIFTSGIAIHLHHLQFPTAMNSNMAEAGMCKAGSDNNTASRMS